MDVSKLNPKGVDYVLQDKQNDKSETKKILLKSTKFFSKNKYLIIIYIIERKIKKIVPNQFDSVFEEYEELY